MNKICKTCGECKDISMYQKNRQAKDGFSKICKECTKEYRERMSREYRRNTHPRMQAVSKKDYCGMWKFLKKIGYDITGEKSVHEQFCDKYSLPYKRRAKKMENKYSPNDCL